MWPLILIQHSRTTLTQWRARSSLEATIFPYLLHLSFTWLTHLAHEDASELVMLHFAEVVLIDERPQLIEHLQTNEAHITSLAC